jgi:hypothetical protein
VAKFSKSFRSPNSPPPLRRHPFPSPGTAPISKWTYRMSVEELKELKKQLTEL